MRLNKEDALRWLEQAEHMILDRYYIPTRYPDALARPAVPYRSYLSKDAQEAINIVTKIVERVKREIEK